MPKILQLKVKNKKGKIVNTGRIEIKNKANNSAELYFYGDIVSDSWQSYWYDEDKCPQDIIDFLAQLDGTEKLDIYMNSGGGSVFAGLAIYNQLKNYKGEKIGHIMSLSASISSVIILACDKVIMHTGSTYMIHKPLCRCEGNANDLRKMAETLDVCEDAIVQVYMNNVKDGVTEETIRNLMTEESWMTSDKATLYFEFEVEESEECIAAVSNYFNSYKNTPKQFVNKGEDKDNNIDYEKITNMVVEKLQDFIGIKKNDPEDVKNEKENILKDLESYGI